MRKYLLAAVAAAAISTPAFATQDNSGYVGIEGGILFPKSQSLSARVDFTDPAITDLTTTHVGNLKYKKGLDLDFVGGYDFGMFRVEGELGYKRAALKSASIDNAFLTAINNPAGTTLGNTSFGLDGHATVLSAMLNGLVDFGGNSSGFGAYAGGGVGYADVKELGNSSGKLAWQLIAGAYVPVSPNIDVGLKYRYFHAGSTNFNHDYAFAAGTGTTCGTVACSGGTASFSSGSKFTSHSLLASLVYNFGATAAPVVESPPPPPPPVAEAPATQTCPDGSVILATSVCPAPPPPPPAPAPVERGERGR
jgi:opacity protein-like surface antigen